MIKHQQQQKNFADYVKYRCVLHAEILYALIWTVVVLIFQYWCSLNAVGKLPPRVELLTTYEPEMTS